ncbi:hypothetical protein QN277_010429 [Acacia crassicarpa]|uniref:Calmodulin-binding domain-containing protein n=2 Tax=Acacia crassicarpa TaxID=499986 RepID=A0AAE1IP02_9FABA|nr:hypothetical protein QN277_010429 [Acacia crassicarpa]
MVQRKVPSKLGIQADHHHVKSDKRLANLSQEGKIRGGADIMKKKKMKKSKSIKLSDMEILKSSSKKLPSFVQVHHPATVSSSSPQKLTPSIRTSDGSPNYMKPTSSSDAKKEFFPVSLRNSKSKPTSSSDAKKELFPVSLRNSESNNSKSNSSVSANKPAKPLTKSSPSLKLVRTLTKTPSFKKSSRVSLCADMNAQRATCSSTLKDSKFPPYLMLNPGATESEGTSVTKVCPYTYCSLNGHRHAPLPPLKSFLSARRRILNIQKSMKMEALSPRKLKVPCEPKKESDTDMDFFIEIYASKQNGDEENIKPTMEEEKNFVTQGDYDDMKQVVASLSDGSPKSEIDSEEDYGKYFDDAKIEQEAKFADEKDLPIWSGEEITIGSYRSEVSYEGEILEGSDSESTDMEWEHEEDNDDADSSILTEENDSKVESLSESSHDVSVMWLDDIISIYYEDIVPEVSQESKAKESVCFEANMEGTDESLEVHQEGNGGANEIVMDATVHSSNFSEETFEELEETGKKNHENNDVLEAENLVNKELLDLEENHEADCIDTVHNDTFDEQENMSLQQDDSRMSQADQITEPLVAETNKKMEEEYNADFKEEIVGNYASDASHDCCEASEVKNSQDQKVNEPCEADKVSEEKKNSSKYIIEEDKLESSRNNWKGVGGRRKRAIQDDDEMRKFNPREPNFLPLVPDPEAEKVDLKHQMMDERKNAEEWMVDYALRQTVTKLAPARKRKVALLVEAFESVNPISKCETHMRNKSSFSHPRPIQACS